MPATHRLRPGAVALLGYVCVAAAFYWPLSASPASALPGPPSGDTGVYVWNLWLFRHEIVANHSFPFFTGEIMSLAPKVPLTLHNYTTFANLLAFPLLPLLGIVATFNVLMMASGVISAMAAFVLLRRLTGDPAAAWVGGLLFGFSPFMTARSFAHFSLVQSAPLPVFALVLDRLHARPTRRLAVMGGVVIAWAFLCDPYYAVYCLMLAGFMGLWLVMEVTRGVERRRLPLRVGLDLALVALAGLIAGIVVRGGGRFEILGIRVSMTHVYTPVLIFTLLAGLRVWLSLRARLRWTLGPLRPYLGAAVTAALTCAVLLSPVLSAMGLQLGDGPWRSAATPWRSSAGGMDVLAFLVPNPTSTWLGWIATPWLSELPHGFIENVASIPWTAIFAIAIALLYFGLRLPRYWTVLTAVFVLLALGPFVEIAGVRTYVPTPWALLRYLPVVGAARMPARLSIVVMLGVAVLLAFAVKQFRDRSTRPWMAPAIVGMLLFVELLPAPRAVFPVAVPAFLREIAADPRPVKVLMLPFGLRDGLMSAGDINALPQFYQTFHEKRMVGGYISRMPRRQLQRYRRYRITRVLLDLSERRPVSAERTERAVESAHLALPRLGVGYVVVDTTRTSPQLLSFVKSAFDLRFAEREGTLELYATPLVYAARR